MPRGGMQSLVSMPVTVGQVFRVFHRREKAPGICRRALCVLFCHNASLETLTRNTPAFAEAYSRLVRTHPRHLGSLLQPIWAKMEDE